jgi:hypothetical protein
MSKADERQSQIEERKRVEQQLEDKIKDLDAGEGAAEVKGGFPGTTCNGGGVIRSQL